MTTIPFNPVNHSPALVTATCRGASGTVYEFQVDPIGASYYERPGVYVFCRSNGFGGWEALYIGETESFKRRLTDDLAHHHRWPSVCAAGATHIATLHVSNLIFGREFIETDLRRAHPTPCNLQ